MEGGGLTGSDCESSWEGNLRLLLLICLHKSGD